SIAETNRAPFDLAEAESELVSGFMTEHAAGIFVFFFLGEYASIILICTLITLILLGGYDIISIFSLLEEILHLFGHSNIIHNVITNISNNQILFCFLHALFIYIKTIILLFSFVLLY